MPAKDACYVLVRTSTEAFDLYERIRDAGVPARVAPAPHGMQACCGTSVMLEQPMWSVRVLLLTRRRIPLNGLCVLRVRSTPLATSSVKGVLPSMLLSSPFPRRSLPL